MVRRRCYSRGVPGSISSETNTVTARLVFLPPARSPGRGITCTFRAADPLQAKWRHPDDGRLNEMDREGPLCLGNVVRVPTRYEVFPRRKQL